MPDTYDLARRDEHSTLGDALERYERDADAFAAGAQYALDRIVADVRALPINLFAGYICGTAADVLTRIHRGELA
ncbi:hypothetical protein [Mycolicibacterium goodii]|uniref:hypothetical protein n=1 Tax=Mycolicibacterium goodii TaxID=134601 RepID=UPI001BDD54A1|nr:hypothetical protein [Mycolicibacterium goodii]MBU8830809.1 hypothetical protein [Mycolicibacterium goodii]